MNKANIVSTFIVVAMFISGAAVAMMVWIVLKIIPNWELHVKLGTANKPLTWSSILASLCSMLFALLGGLIVRGQLKSTEARLQAILNEQDPLRKVLLLAELEAAGPIKWFKSPSSDMDLQTLQEIASSTVALALLRDSHLGDQLVHRVRNRRTGQ